MVQGRPVGGFGSLWLSRGRGLFYLRTRVVMRGSPAGIVMGLVIACLGAFVFFSQNNSTPSPEELVELALNAPSDTERAAAAIKLADYGEEALAGLRRVAKESTEPAVTAVSIEGLSKLWDYDSMDLFLDLAENGPPHVRGRAAQTVMRMTGRHRPYSASAPAADRQLLVKHMRADWEAIKAASPEDRDELKRRLRESDEMR
jgi:hypothetical protein